MWWIVQSGVSNLDIRPLSLVYRALGDETRLRMVALLVHGELCVCHIEKGLGISQPNASRQLGILRAAGIVDYRRDGSWVYYFISPGNHEMVEAQLEFLTKQFRAERTLKADHARVRKSCGPDACK
ncbi:MAG: metalloregulator ArsR/SmtB family transcription factor [Kofleriaceae bacterium]